MKKTDKLEQVLNFEGTLSIGRADTIKKDLINTLNETDNLVVDLSKVESIDLSFIQILYAVKKEAVLKKKSFNITGSIDENIKKLLSLTNFFRSFDNDLNLQSGES